MPSAPSSRSRIGRTAPHARCAIVVLGELAASPRILQHALSMTELAQIDLVGYGGAELPLEVRDHPAIAVHGLPPEAPLDPARGGLLWADACARLVRQSWRLLRRLLTLPRPDVVLVQSPPALPTLAVTALAARWRGARWVIDWHNLGFSLLALKLGREHLAVRLARRAEILLGRRADAHLCVSAAMRDALASRFGIAAAHVVYDRPAARFTALPRDEASRSLERLLADLGLAGNSAPRPVVAVGPTSFTLDEDLGLLLDALDRCDRALARERSLGVTLPDLLVLLTGKGPLRTEIEARCPDARWTAVRLRCAWLSPEDYARLLASADLGLCLHHSSSQLDLPMKIADMLGAALPVCALDYAPVLGERFRAGVHGILFSDAVDLSRVLTDLLRDFGSAGSKLATMRRRLREGPVERWADGWRREARPLFADLLAERRRAPRLTT